MSRTHHARPPRPHGDGNAGIRNAAVGVADAFIRFEREFARLQRELASSTESLDDKTAAINLAGRGRPDRERALIEVFARVQKHEGDR